MILTGEDGGTIIGPSVPMSLGEERLADPDMSEPLKTGQSTAGWTLPEGVLSAVPGAIPDRTGRTFVYKGVQPGCEIRGARVAIQPGDSFVQSAWLRGGEGSSWGRRYFDAGGKELKAADIYDYGSGVPADSFGWTLVEKRLESALSPDESVRSSGGGAERIPANAAFIEPVLRLNYYLISWEPKPSASWAGLSLRRVPPAIVDQPKPAPRRDSFPEGFEAFVEPSGEPLTADKATTARNEGIFAAVDSEVQRLVVSPESDLVVAGCADGTLHFFDYPSGKERGVVRAHDDPIIEAAMLPNGTGVYSVDARGDTHLVTLKPETDELVACTAFRPRAAAVSPLRRWVIFAGVSTADDQPADRTRLEVVDLTTGKQVRVIEQKGSFQSLALSPDEKQVTLRHSAGMNSSVVYTWELPAFNKLPDRTEDRGQITYGGNTTRPLFVADPARNRYVMVESTGRFVVRTMNNEILWTFRPANGANSLAVMPEDGAILVSKPDRKVWRCVSPK